jgi:nucleotide-binding universal stress UspA family protein
MKIVVGIDNSPSARTVLDAVIHRPWPGDAEFCVLNIVNIHRFERLPALIEDANRESLHLLEEATKQIRGAGIEAFSRTSPGHPRSDISCFAKEWGADLILVGSHGHGAVGRFLLGSVAQGVLRTAPCSVEIVRSKAESSSALFKVLFATDGSECSVAAAHAVAAQPWSSGSVFKVLSVEELLTVGNQMEAASLSAIYPASLLEELITQAHESAHSAVDGAKDILRRAGLKLAEGELAPVGDPRSVILDAAKAWGAHLIVVGSHGKHGLDRLLLGSVSEAVAIHASCSVRVVRAQQRAKGNGHAA